MYRDRADLCLILWDFATLRKLVSAMSEEAKYLDVGELHIYSRQLECDFKREIADTTDKLMSVTLTHCYNDRVEHDQAEEECNHDDGQPSRTATASCGIASRVGWRLAGTR